MYPFVFYSYTLKKGIIFLKSLLSSSMGKHLNLFPCLFYFSAALKQVKSFHKI